MRLARVFRQGKKASDISFLTRLSSSSIPQRPNQLSGVLKEPIVHKIGDNLRLHSIPGSICNIYAVEYIDTKRVLLLDGGCASDVTRVKTYLNTLPHLSIGNIEMVVSSHAHPDHAGGAHIWKYEHGIRVIAPKGINEWYNGPLGFIQWRIELGLVRYLETLNTKGSFGAIFPSIWSMIFPSHDPKDGVYFPRSLDWDHQIPTPGPLASVEDLNTPIILDDSFMDWVAIAVPGHTDHMIALYHPSTLTLYTADALVHIQPQYGLQYSIQQDFLPLLIDSLIRLSHLKVRYLLMAHGGVYELRAADTTTTTTTTTADDGDVSTEPSTELTKSVVPSHELPYMCINFSNTLQKLARSLHGLRKVTSLTGWRGIVHEIVNLPINIKYRHIESEAFKIYYTQTKQE